MVRKNLVLGLVSEPEVDLYLSKCVQTATITQETGRNVYTGLLCGALLSRREKSYLYQNMKRILLI